MAAQDDKNFRSHYYERVGFRGVDERKTVDALLAEDPVSVPRCSAFALKCAVPADRRTRLWAAVLGVASAHAGNREFVRRWRRLAYTDVKKELCSRESGLSRANQQSPQSHVRDITLVFLLFAKRLKFDFEAQV